MAFSDPREDKKLRPSLSERWTARTFTRQVVAPTIKDLADLLKRRNQINERIAGVVGRPALAPHICEYIASEVFDIELESPVTQAECDGRFCSGPLTGKTVRIKHYGKPRSYLDINPRLLPEYYLVLAGPKKTAATSLRRGARPFVIEGVFLFDAHGLFDRLTQRGAKIGIATNIRSEEWDRARIFPQPSEFAALTVTSDQAQSLNLFRHDLG